MDDREVWIQKFASVTSRVVMLGSGIGSILYLTNRLGVTGYGEYASLIAIASLIRFPIESLFQAAIPLMVGEKEPDHLGSAILRAMTISGTVLTALSILVGSLAPQFLRIDSMTIWCAMSFDILCTLISNGYLVILIAKNHFLASSIIFGVHWIARFLFAVALIEMGLGALGAILAIPLAALLQFLLCAATDRGRAIVASRVTWEELWNKSKIYSLSMLLERMLYSCDLVAMRLFYASPLAIGFYATGLSLSQAFLAISRSLSPVHLQMLAYHRSKNEQEKFNSLVHSMLVENVRMIGLAILGLPFLPMVIQLLFGRDISSTQGVFALIIAAASFQLLFSSGRIINVASGDLSQMRLLLFVLLLLQTIGFGIAVFYSSSPDPESPKSAVFQANCCAVVSIVCNLILAVYALNMGLLQSKQPFPWKPTLRILLASSALALGGLYCLKNGVSAYLMLPLVVVAYYMFLIRTGDFALSLQSFRFRTNGAME